MREKEVGLYGGLVLRSINEDGIRFVRGAILPASVTSSWPIKNRMAFHKASKIQFYDMPPAEALDGDVDEPGELIEGALEVTKSDTYPTGVSADSAEWKKFDNAKLAKFAADNIPGKGNKPDFVSGLKLLKVEFDPRDPKEVLAKLYFETLMEKGGANE